MLLTLLIQGNGWRNHRSIHYALPCGRSHKSLLSFKLAKKSSSAWKCCYFLIRVSTRNFLQGGFSILTWFENSSSENMIMSLHLSTNLVLELQRWSSHYRKALKMFTKKWNWKITLFLCKYFLFLHNFVILCALHVLLENPKKA